MAKIIATVGIPGSGKSTWAQQQVDKNSNMVRINRDDIRTELLGEEYHKGAPDRRSEKMVTREATKRTVSALKNGKTVIRDDTNLSPRAHNQLSTIAKKLGADYQIEYINVPASVAKKRNHERGLRGGRRVPDFVIDNMTERAYGDDGNLRKMRRNRNGAYEVSTDTVTTFMPESPSSSSSAQKDVWHISPTSGVSRCRVGESRSGIVRGCPFGEEDHFPTQAEAQKVFEDRQSKKYGASATFTAASSSSETTSLSDVIDVKSFKNSVDTGLISEREHPDDPNLKIYSYTSKVQFGGLWTEDTLLARGLMLNTHGDDSLMTADIVARGLPKFFTVEQMEEGDWSNLKIIDDDENVTISDHAEIDFEARATVSEKLNGALGLLYLNPSGEPAISTRGSFESLEAGEGTKILDSYDKEELKRLLEGEYRGDTLLFEIITPKRPHPVDYGDMEDLVFLGTVENSSGTWTPAGEEDAVDSVGFPKSEVTSYSNLKEALDAPYKDNTEGFVVTIDGEEGQQMYKIKPEEYSQVRRLFYSVQDNRIKPFVDSMSFDDYSSVRSADDIPVDKWIGAKNLDLSEGSNSSRLIREAQEKVYTEVILPTKDGVKRSLSDAALVLEETGFDKKSYALKVKDRKDRGELFAAYEYLEAQYEGRSNSEEKLFNIIKKKILKG